MKKRNFSFVPSDRNSRGKPLHRPRNSKPHTSTAKSLRDFAFQKKVKFTAKDAGPSSTCGLEASTIPVGRKEDTTYAKEPKTSEYAFFKKLKEGAGQIRHSSSPQKDAYLSKPEPNDCFRERTKNNKDFDHSTLIENTPTVGTDSFLPPFGGALKKTDRDVVGGTDTRDHFQGYGDTLQSNLPNDMFLQEETQSGKGKTFLRKRQKLRQWVADTSFPDTDKFCSKGQDIVSMLLTRLIPDCNEENKYNYPKSRTSATATSHGLLVSQDSDIQYEEHYRHGKKLLELDSKSYSSNHLSSPMFHGSDDRIISRADFSTNHSDKFYPLYTIREPEYNFAGIASFAPHWIKDPECNFRETVRNRVNNAIAHGCLFNEQEHKAFAWNRFNELGKLRGDLYPLPLENNLGYPADEINIRGSYDCDIHYNGQCHGPRQKLLELGSSSQSSDHLASPILRTSDDRIIQCADFSTYHSLKRHPPSCSTTEPDCNFGVTSSFSPYCITIPGFNFGEKTPFKANNNMTHGFLFNEMEHKTLIWNHLNEPWKHGRGSYHLLLDNGSDSPAADDIHIPINHNNAKLNIGPALFPSKGNCNEFMLNNTSGAYQLYPSSIFPSEPLDFNHNSLSLSSSDGHLKLLEERQSDHSCVPGSFYLPLNRHMFSRTASHDYHHQADANTRAWLSSSLNFFTGKRCLSLVGPHPDHQFPNQGNLQLALGDKASDPFHFEDTYEHDPDGVKDGEIFCHFKDDDHKRLTLPFFSYTEESPFLLRNSDHISDKGSNTQDAPADSLWLCDRS